MRREFGTLPSSDKLLVEESRVSLPPPEPLLRLLTRPLLRLLTRPRLRRPMNFLLNVALRSKGYNNYRSIVESGESWFVRRLATVSHGVCIDVGANLGEYSEELLLVGFDQVFAYEPHPAHGSSLGELSAAFPGRLHVIEKAVGECAGEASLLFNPNALSHASLSPEANDIAHIENTEKVAVRVVSLDEELQERGWQSIALLKIDTEGFEADVLKGSRRLLADCPPLVVQLEFGPHQLMRGQSLRYLSQFLGGYRVYQLLPFGNGVRPVNPDESDANFYYFSNFVFVRADFAGTLFPS